MTRGVMNDRFTGYGKIRPGVNADKFDKPKPKPGGGIVRKATEAVKNAVRGGNPNPEKTPAWKERQAKIDVAKLRNSGARTRKSGRI